MKNIVTRFAPSPTGYIHLGNLRSAFFSFLYAKQNNGNFFLRIDDTDTERSKNLYTQSILEDLEWLGIEFDNQYLQSKRSNIYEKHFQTLLSCGLIYECFETDEELKNRAKRPYRFKENTLNPKAYNTSYWRFKLMGENSTWYDLVKGEQSINCHNFSDPVIRKSNGDFTYNFTSVCDDVELEVSHIIRGEDHTSNTAVHKVMFKALGIDTIEFAHLPFLVDKDGKSLSKRIDSLSIKNLRGDGIVPEAILSFIFSLGGNTTKLMSISQMIENFSIKSYRGAMPKIIIDGLYKLNSKACHNLKFEKIESYWSKFAVIANADLTLTENTWEFIKENVETLKDIPVWQLILKKWQRNDAKDLKHTINEMFPKDGIKVLETTATLSQNINWDSKNLENLFKNVTNKINIKGKPFFMSLRLAITRINHGSNLQSIMLMIGKEEFLKRLYYVMENS